MMKPLPRSTPIREAAAKYIERCEAELRLVRELLEQRDDLTIEQILEGVRRSAGRTPRWSHDRDETKALKLAWGIVNRENIARERKDAA